jgi:AcrR family transcriptional regulator
MVKRRYDADATRRDLILAGSRAFSSVGYAGARAEEIVAAAGLSRGSLYHHFDGKHGLFRAVLEALQEDLAAEIRDRALAITGGPMERLRVGFQTYLDFALRADVRRILLVDGPGVLGWDTWRQIDLEHGFKATRGAIMAAVAAGEIEPCPVEHLPTYCSALSPMPG